MTTVVYKDGVMVGDGQVTRYDSLIESTTCVKVRNIGGTLVGGAGNGISIMKFFDWYADNVETAWAQSEYSNLNILPPEDLVEEDFQALVVSPDGSVFEYIGTKNIFPITEDYAAIGSGCLYAYPLMDAGMSAREAVDGAIKRDPYSGGLVTEITFEQQEELTEADIRAMSHEDLLKLVLGEENEEEFPANVSGFENTPDLDKIHQEILANEGVESIIDFVKGTKYLPSLKCIATHYRIKYSHNIGIEKLRQRILDFLVE